MPDDDLLLIERGLWEVTARPKQLPPPGDWRTWLVMAGRGFGKTRTGAEWVREEVMSGRRRRVALVGRTAADVRDVMIEGESGIVRVCERYRFPARYEPSKRRVAFANGAVATLFSADEPDLLRGPEHDGFWADEIAAWRDPEAWDNLQFGLRIGDDPRGVATTTPKPVKVVRELVADPSTVVIGGTTYENRSNLAPSFFTQIIRRYEGTRTGRQELLGELLEDVEGALWKRSMIDPYRLTKAPELDRVVVAVDPATTHGEGSDFTGIVAAGRGRDGHAYVLSGTGYKLAPLPWGERVIATYDQWEADHVVAEANNGGELVRSNILATLKGQRRLAPRIELVHAKRGKVLRADPVANLYEQGRVHHVGTFGALEDQMCLFPVANENDDLVDALVYAITDLMGGVDRTLYRH